MSEAKPFSKIRCPCGVRLLHHRVKPKRSEALFTNMAGTPHQPAYLAICSGRYGCGEGCSRESFAFVDFLADAGFSVWQVLPLVPPDEEYWSPYSGKNAFCGNTLLISIDRLVHWGLVTQADADKLASAVRNRTRREEVVFRDCY